MGMSHDKTNYSLLGRSTDDHNQSGCYHNWFNKISWLATCDWDQLSFTAHGIVYLVARLDRFDACGPGNHTSLSELEMVNEHDP